MAPRKYPLMRLLDGFQRMRGVLTSIFLIYLITVVVVLARHVILFKGGIPPLGELAVLPDHHSHTADVTLIATRKYFKIVKRSSRREQGVCLKRRELKTCKQTVNIRKSVPETCNCSKITKYVWVYITGNICSAKR